MRWYTFIYDSSESDPAWEGAFPSEISGQIKYWASVMGRRHGKLFEGYNLTVAFYDEIATQVTNLATVLKPIVDMVDEIESYNCPEHGEWLLKNHCPKCRRLSSRPFSDSMPHKQNFRNSKPHRRSSRRR